MFVCTYWSVGKGPVLLCIKYLLIFDAEMYVQTLSFVRTSTEDDGLCMQIYIYIYMYAFAYVYACIFTYVHMYMYIYASYTHIVLYTLADGINAYDCIQSVFL